MKEIDASPNLHHRMPDYFSLYEDQNINLDAELSRAAYSLTPRVRDWVRDEELSNYNRSVYTKAGKAKIAYRGTKPTNWDDLGTDILIATGLQDYSSRFQNAKITAQKTIQKYGKQNVSLTGHSLGGAQSAWVSRELGLPATGFNSGWGPRDLIRQRTYSKFHNITVAGDIVSASGATSTFQKQTRLPSRKNPHGLSHFLEHHFPREDIRVSAKAHGHQARVLPVIQGAIPESQMF